MKNILILGVFLLFSKAFSQTKAVTDDGKAVVLFEDKTWKFVNESDALVWETISTNPTLYVKNKNATALLRSKILDIGINYNPNRWTISTQKRISFIEHLLNYESSGKMLIGFMVTEKVEIPTLKNLKDILLAGVQSRVDYFRLKKAEYRIVNGLKVLYLHYIANIKGLDFEYVGNYYLDSAGYSGIVGYSLQKDYEQNAVEIEDFLNGLVSAKKQEEIIYTNPPPPMQTP